MAITSSIYPDPDTHIEVVTYGQAGDAMSGTFTAMTGAGTRLTRPLKWIGAMLRHPLQTLRDAGPLQVVAADGDPAGDADRRRRDAPAAEAQAVRPRRAAADRAGPRRGRTRPSSRPPTQAARWFAKRTGGIAQSALTESIQNVPTTAHILGGAVIGAGPESGVVDAANRVFGYENLLVTDGAAIPANPGVNPSLTITAKAEHAMSLIPPKDGSGAAPPPRGGAARDSRRSLALSRRRRGAGRRSPS